MTRSIVRKRLLKASPVRRIIVDVIQRPQCNHGCGNRYTIDSHKTAHKCVLNRSHKGRCIFGCEVRFMARTEITTRLSLAS
jgi:hypothetical protein